MTSNHSANPARIALLVDRFLAHENAQAAKRAPSPAKPTSVTTEPTTPARKTPTPKPPSVPKTEPQQGEKKAMPIRKPKVAAKHRTPTKPKPRGVSVSIPAELLEPSGDYLPPLPPPGTPQPRTRSAHGVVGPTPCYTCGGPCEPIEGRHGLWRRHEACSRVTQGWQRLRAAAEHYAIPVTDDEAQAAPMYVPTYAERHVGAIYTDGVTKPWAHVLLPEIVSALMIAKRRIADAKTPLPCDLGRCGWCGTEKSLTWQSFGHRFPDGTEAPLCRECSTIYVRRGYPTPTYPDDARLVLVEAITGVPASMGDTAPAALRAFHEVGNGGAGEPWDYLPSEAVEALRWALWGRFNGKHAPVEHRVEAVARHRAREADRAAKLTAIEQVDPFGFGGGQEVEDDG